MTYPKEWFWLEHELIGYVPLDAEGRPYRALVKREWYGQPSPKPPRIYKTIETACRYSPVGNAAEVRMFTRND